MASYKGHIAGGFIAAAVYTAVISFAPVEQFAASAKLLGDWQTIASVFIIAMLFSLFPDVDTKSKGQLLFYWTVFIIDIILIWSGNIQAAAYFGLIAILPVLSRHRGWTHSKWAAFVIPIPIIVIPYLHNDAMLPISFVYYGAAVVGYLSHLLFDGLVIHAFRIRG